MSFWSSANISPATKYRFKMGPAGNVWWYTNTVTLPSFEINTNEYQLLNQKFRYPGVTSWNPVTINIVDVADSFEQIKKILGFQNFEFFQQDSIQKGLGSEVREAALAGIDTELEAAIVESNAKRDREQAGIGSGTGEISELFLQQRGIPLPAEAAQDRERNLRAAAELKKRGLSPVEDNDLIIQQIKDDGKVLRTWTLVNSFVSSVNYGDLDYSSDDLVSIEIVVTYDYATTDK